MPGHHKRTRTMSTQTSNYITCHAQNSNIILIHSENIYFNNKIRNVHVKKGISLSQNMSGLTMAFFFMSLLSEHLILLLSTAPREPNSGSSIPPTRVTEWNFTSARTKKWQSYRNNPILYFPISPNIHHRRTAIQSTPKYRSENKRLNIGFPAKYELRRVGKRVVYVLQNITTREWMVRRMSTI